jgi:regulator of ribosome biosynthesis
MLVIPREKPLPKPKKETKWEKFAREKGIQKRKKGRMIYDEEKEEYAPRFGYKKANDDLHDWAMEMKNGQDIMQDPWEAKQKEKNQRIHKNLENQAKNLVSIKFNSTKLV